MDNINLKPVLKKLTADEFRKLAELAPLINRLSDLLDSDGMDEVEKVKKEIRAIGEQSQALKEAAEFYIGLAEQYHLRIDHFMPAIEKPPAQLEPIRRKSGLKYSRGIIKHLLRTIPVSTRHFTMTNDNMVIYCGKAGNRNIEIQIAKPFVKPASGDLAFRSALVACEIASQKRTPAPGKIGFNEFVTLIGEKEASQITRENLMNYLNAFECSYIRVWEDRGRSFSYKSAPLFAEIAWSQDEGKGAVFSFILNERAWLMAKEMRQYTWIPTQRLLGLPGLSARDHRAQDNFRLWLNRKPWHGTLRRWLQEFAEYTERKLTFEPIAKIETFVEKNFSRAKRDGLVVSYKIDKLEKRRDYLNQKIYFAPAKNKPNREYPDPAEVEDFIDGAVEWLYNPEHYFNIEYPEEKTRECLKNIIYSHGLESVKGIFEYYEGDPTYWLDGVSPAVSFWRDLKGLGKKRDNAGPSQNVPTCGR